MSADRPSRDPLLPALVLVAVLARILRGTSSEILNADGYFFIEAAARFAGGEWNEALRTGLHPLYPLLLAAVRSVTGDGWLAGATISVAAASGALVALYGLAREGWGIPAARGAAFLFAIHPVLSDWDGKVLSDGLYRLCALWAILLGWRALRDGSWRLGAAAGVCLSAAHLTRSEGVLLAMLFFGAGGVLALVLRSRRAAAALAAAAVALAILSGPYLLWIRSDRGEWRPSPRGSVERAIQAGALKTYDDSGREVKRREAYGLGPAAAMNVAVAVYRTYYVPPFLLAAAGLAFFRRGAGGGPTGLFLGLISAGNLAAVGLLYYLSVTHISYRYVALACVLLLPWAGRGLSGILEKLSSIPRAAPVFTLLVALSMLPRILLGQPGRDDRSLLEAAAWIRTRAAGRPRIACSTDALAYHAGGRFVFGARPEEVLGRIERGEVDYLAYTEEDLAVMSPRVTGAPGVREAVRFGPEGRSVRVYVVDTPGPVRDGR